MRAVPLAAALLGTLAAVDPAAGQLMLGAVYTWRLIGRPCASYLTGQTPCDSHRVFFADTATPDSYWQLLAGDSPGMWSIKQSGGRGGRIVHCNNNRMYLGVEQSNQGQAANCKKFVQTYRKDAQVYLEPTGNGPMQYNIIPTSHAQCENFRAISANPCDQDDWATMANPRNPEDPAYGDFQLTCVEGCTATAAPSRRANIAFTDAPSDDTAAPTAATETPTGSPMSSAPSMSPTVDCNHPDIIRLTSPVALDNMAIESVTQKWLEPSIFMDFPKDQDAPGRWLQGGRLYVLDKHRKCFPKGQNLTIECRSDICDVYVFLYHQPPNSGPTNGDLVAALPNGGWTPGGHCAPKFWHQDSPNCKHRMLTFRKRLECQQTVDINVDPNKPAAYMAIAAVRGVDCSDNGRGFGSDDCTALPPTRGSTCQWVQGECKDMWCPPLPPQQPNPNPGRGSPSGCAPPDLVCE